MHPEEIVNDEVTKYFLDSHVDILRNIHQIFDELEDARVNNNNSVTSLKERIQNLKVSDIQLPRINFDEINGNKTFTTISIISIISIYTMES